MRNSVMDSMALAEFGYLSHGSISEPLSGGCKGIGQHGRFKTGKRWWDCVGLFWAHRQENQAQEVTMKALFSFHKWGKPEHCIKDYVIGLAALLGWSGYFYKLNFEQLWSTKGEPVTLWGWSHDGLWLSVYWDGCFPPTHSILFLSVLFLSIAPPRLSLSRQQAWKWNVTLSAAS